MPDTHQPLLGPDAALLALDGAIAARRPDLLVEPVRVAGVAALRVHLGGDVALDVFHQPTAWSVVPVQLGPPAVTPLRVPAAHDLGVAADAPVELVVDALGRDAHAWAPAALGPVPARAATSGTASAGTASATGDPAAGTPASAAAPATATVATPRRRSAWTVAGLVLAGVVVIGGTVLAAGNGYGPDVDLDAAGGDDLVFDLVVGQCFDETDDLDDETQLFVDVHHCGTDHQYEVFGTVALADGRFPGDDRAQQLGDEGCYALFEPYVGAEWEESELDYAMYWPSAEAWRTGERDVTCLLVEPAGHGSGSAELSGR
ncbi:septum formation family protein [Frigoribacterium salinisoli]